MKTKKKITLKLTPADMREEHLQQMIVMEANTDGKFAAMFWNRGNIIHATNRAVRKLTVGESVNVFRDIESKGWVDGNHCPEARVEWLNAVAAEMTEKPKARVTTDLSPSLYASVMQAALTLQCAPGEALRRFLDIGDVVDMLFEWGACDSAAAFQAFEARRA